jgi:protein SMG6
LYREISNLDTESKPKACGLGFSPTVPFLPQKQQYVVVSRPTPDADPEDFSRRLRISSSPSLSPKPSQSTKARKLFNPDTDPIPMRRTDPEPISGSTSIQQASRPPPPSSSTNHRDERGNTARHLFDHRKDNPVRFSVMARPQLLAPGRPSPTPKPLRDHVSASSNLSYAASISSSAFTLSSTTDETSTSSSLFDGRPNQDRAENSIFAHQLKRLYREISNLEAKVKQEDSMDDTDDVMSSRVVLKDKEVESDDLEKENWKKQMSDHKTLVFFVHPGNIFSYLKRL